MSVIHTYKTWPSFFGAILNGTKTFEVRKDDRDPAPQVGDWLELREYEPGFERYTDRLVRLEISYVLRDSEHFPFPGYIVIGFKNPNIAAEKALREKAERELDAANIQVDALAESERAMRSVVEAAENVDKRCPEGFNGEDEWTNEAHRLLRAALARYSEIKEKA